MSGKPVSILIVDDEAPLRELLKDLLGNQYDCTTAAGADEAVALLESRHFNLVMSDITMPGTTGLELCQLIQRLYSETVVVMVSGVTDINYAIQAMRQGAFDYVTKPFDIGHLTIAVDRAVRYQELLAARHRQRQTLENTVRTRTHQLTEANDRLNRVNATLNQMLEALYSNYRATLRALACTIEARDYETGGHSDRVVSFSLRLGRELGLSGSDLVGLEQGALLHDIGKIGVPDAVLQKKGPLTAEEWQEMRKHPLDGLRILEGIDLLAFARPVVAQHHEKFDGSGYPAALRGDAIHLYARIFAVADAFDAITSDRPYHLAESYETARKRISEGSGGHFDPEIVAAFRRVPEEEWDRLRGSSGAPGYAEKVIDKEQIHSLILSLTTLVGPSPIETRAEATPCADQGFPPDDGKLTVAISGLSSGIVNR